MKRKSKKTTSATLGLGKNCPHNIYIYYVEVIHAFHGLPINQLHSLPIKLHVQKKMLNPQVLS